MGRRRLLSIAGLANTALARTWIAQAARAVSDPRPVELPYREEGFIAPEKPSAVGYGFRLERGRVLTIRVEVESDEATRVFVDLYRISDAPAGSPRPVRDAERTGGQIVYEPSRTGDYVVRVQPELLRGGVYTITLGGDPALAFPVAGRGTAAIQSFFGDSRDGGSRDHHGVDIFAPRGTPVLAAAPGTIRRANVTPIGGKVVWLRDGRGRSLYYAHLDSQAVSGGERVGLGDTLGFVGNTGNARTTPPHLHFGVYWRGGRPTPFPFCAHRPG